MTADLVIVSGTGTGVGKTHFSAALLKTLQGFFQRVTGLKPIETGLVEGTPSDAERLQHASSFHVQHSGYTFAEPLSPHLAARRAARSIEVPAIRSIVEAARRQTDLTLVELAGGLFTPISDTELNADVLRSLNPDKAVLVGPDRLGVLHEVLATLRAASSFGITIDAVVLMAPEAADASTGLNTMELLRFMGLHLPRGEVNELALHPAVLAMARALAERRPMPRPARDRAS
jgi:dethiobiotin synthetase